MSVIFGYDEYRDLIKTFATKVPQLLGQHASTSPLALDVQKLGILDTLDTRFTVAVVGQMRVGKSTLLNSLIGRDLAPTGVNETTATVNWFRDGKGDISEQFRVHWKDGSSEDKPLAEVAAWLGEGKNATDTLYLDFFSSSEFLGTANLVDTPGTRSVLDTHEGATRGFVLEEDGAEAQDETTRQTGSRADAVLYVVNPVARQKDSDLLQMFGDNTRMPGASVHNSIAVIQKWEDLGDTDPIIAAEKKCARMKQQLEGKVAEVIPVSGLLGRYVQTLPMEVWDKLALLGTKTEEMDFEDLRSDQEFFLDEMEEVPVSVAERKALKGQVIWPAIRFLLLLARIRKVADGAGLRQAADEASGLARLRSLLFKRFFAHAELIKANTVLRKAWDPCTVGLGRLRGLEKSRENDVRSVRRAIELVSSSPMTPEAKAEVSRTLESSQGAVEADLATIQRLRTSLDALQHQVLENFKALESDMETLAALEGEEAFALDADQKRVLALVCGLGGAEPWRRLGFEAPQDDKEALIGRAEDLLDDWEGQQRPGIGHRRLAAHVCRRLNQLLDYLESH